jgi:hypothetical protein
VEPEDVVHVLRNVQEALEPRGLLFDIHPTADDVPVRAHGRGIGFIDSRGFQPVLATTNNSVDALVADGSFDDVRRVEREIEEWYDDPGELLETADEWASLTTPAATRRKIRAADPPLQLLWRVDFRLLRKRRARPRRRP